MAILAMAIVLLLGVSSLRLSRGVSGIAELVQATDASISTLAFLGAAIFFLLTVENRLKRRRALATLHQLRSVAHVVDMHQLTKDPARVTATVRAPRPRRRPR